MHLVDDLLRRLVQRLPCCCLRAVAVSNLAPRERAYFKEFMSSATTALVLGHHVTTQQEWTWYAKDNGGEHCAGDDHAEEVCRQIKGELKIRGFPTQIVPYPGESGLQFRFVAEAGGMGKIGKNAFLLHPEWGPWIHLRVIATGAPIELEVRYVDSVCNDCGECLSACPAGAIADDKFDGLTCRSFRKSKGEYTPIGPKQELRYCKICADVCPIGPKPKGREEQNDEHQLSKTGLFFTYQNNKKSRRKHCTRNSG